MHIKCFHPNSFPCEGVRSEALSKNPSLTFIIFHQTTHMKRYIKPALKAYNIELEAHVMANSQKETSFDVNENEETQVSWAGESIWNDNDWNESEE